LPECHFYGTLFFMTKPLGYMSLLELSEDWASAPYEVDFVNLTDNPEKSPDVDTPVEATQRLERTGYKEKDYLHIINNRLGSHDTRADIIVAIGETPRLGWLFREIDVLDGEEEAIVPFTFHDGMVITALQKRLDGTAK
jgi:hypothetical protein